MVSINPYLSKNSIISQYYFNMPFSRHSNPIEQNGGQWKDNKTLLSQIKRIFTIINNKNIQWIDFKNKSLWKMARTDMPKVWQLNIIKIY